MKIFNQFGAQFIAYNVNELLALPTMSLRFGSDGRTYFWNSATLFQDGDNKYYEVIIQNFQGTRSLTLGDTAYDAVP